jgi:hypothetical protein
MRRMTIVGLAAALVAGLMLLPAGSSARSTHKSCPRSARVDRNHDRIPDRWECRHGLSLKVKQTRRDQDRDGLNNLGEFKAGDDPRDADTDNDGIRDGAEHAGTIQSFVADQGSPNTGTLTIALDGGGTVSGRVTANTECTVRPATTPTASASRDGESGDDHGGDNSGPGSTSSGDNQNETENENEANENEANENQNENENNGCTAAELSRNRVVREAELKVTSAGTVFDEIKLA